MTTPFPAIDDELMELNPNNYKEKESNIEVERVGNDIFLIEGTGKNNLNGIIHHPSVISLDKIPNFSNLFVCVHPFIFHGYRIHHSMRDCFKSLFTLHNETLNIWSHLIPFFIFLSLFLFDGLGNYYYNLILIPFFKLSTD